MLTLAGKTERLRRLLSMKEDYVRLLIEQDNHHEAIQVCNQGEARRHDPMQGLVWTGACWRLPQGAGGAGRGQKP